MRVVALGGGHGLAASLAALREVSNELTAVVTVADDGGSSGRLRTELDALPPGDLRMALAALASRDEWGEVWANTFQHRFGGSGALAGHALGNLVIAALSEVTGSEVAALDLAGTLLKAAGRVLPLTTDRVDIVAEVAGLEGAGLTRVRGQVAVATTTGRVVDVRLEPESPAACAEAVQAVLAADFIVLGPGSLFTSVFPHLMIAEMRAAIVKSSAQRVFTLNLVAQPGETSGYSPEAHLEALAAHAPELRVDHVIADASVLDRSGLMDAAATLGAAVTFAAVAAPDAPGRHDARRLAAAYRALMTEPVAAGEAE